MMGFFVAFRRAFANRLSVSSVLVQFLMCAGFCVCFTMLQCQINPAELRVLLLCLCVRAFTTCGAARSCSLTIVWLVLFMAFSLAPARATPCPHVIAASLWLSFLDLWMRCGIQTREWCCCCMDTVPSSSCARVCMVSVRHIFLSTSWLSSICRLFRVFCLLNSDMYHWMFHFVWFAPPLHCLLPPFPHHTAALPVPPPALVCTHPPAMAIDYDGNATATFRRAAESTSPTTLPWRMQLSLLRCPLQPPLLHQLRRHPPRRPQRLLHQLLRPQRLRPRPTQETSVFARMLMVAPRPSALPQVCSHWPCAHCG